jgi:hypothetical protein
MKCECVWRGRANNSPVSGIWKCEGIEEVFGFHLESSEGGSLAEVQVLCQAEWLLGCYRSRERVESAAVLE